jgi:hypothetical protein
MTTGAVRITTQTAVVAVGSAFLACALGLVVSISTTSAVVRFADALAFLLLALGAAHSIARRQVGDSLNLLSLSALFYLIAFFAGALYVWFNSTLNLGQGASVIPKATISGAVAMSAVGWICFAAGYFADPLRSIRSVAPPPNHLAGRVSAAAVVVSLLVIGWVARAMLLASGRYYHIHTSPVTPTSSSWFVSMAALLPLFALGIVGAKAFGLAGNASKRGWRIPFGVLVLTELAWAVPSGAREEVVEVLAAVVIVRYYALGRLPSWKTSVAVVVAFVFVVFPVINSYRLGNFRSSPTGALLAATNQIRADNLSETLRSGGDTLARFADVTALARILQVGRGQIDYSSANTVLYALEDFIPRAILPGKGNYGALGNTFGRTYEFISPSDFSTSIAITEPGELYLGGGWLGLLLGMAILGGVLRLLDEYLHARRWDAGMLGLYAVIAPLVVIGLESSIAVGFLGTIKATIFLALVVAAVAWLIPRDARSRAIVPGRSAAE